MKYFLLAALLITAAGCRSYPKRDLSTSQGVLAGYFNRKPEAVRKLEEEGFSREDIAGIFLITSSTHLTEENVIEEMNDKTLEEIASEAGIMPEEFQSIRRRVLEDTL